MNWWARNLTGRIRHLFKARVGMVDMKLPTSLDRANLVGVLPCGWDGAFQHCRAKPNALHSQPLSLWGQIQWRPTGVRGKGCAHKCPLPPKLLNNLYKKGYVYNRHQLYVLLQHYKGFWCVHHTTIASFTLQHCSKAISNSCHHHKMLYKICPAKRCSQLHIHHANSCSEQVPNSSYLDFWLTGSNLVIF